ncbi:MAG: hypothetical protein GWN51_13075, partial [Gemmatimonadetes bacterium]|nr:hypothetical protein [Gemmatimonadota bacterium]NIT65835.1 hypothetical protein [Gemmatimonadota bacterium]NIU53147.1 hypothetical protein [Gemmatimonadota bacterium]NIV24567.1 hypothetical protein [Gemmatimonadota bacterium]NIW76481.1 hypothetical protein [Gemmatimonadota bacterium]
SVSGHGSAGHLYRDPGGLRPTIWSWITTVDHKRIGIMYGVAALFFLIIGGVEALLMRIQLA